MSNNFTFVHSIRPSSFLKFNEAGIEIFTLITQFCKTEIQ